MKDKESHDLNSHLSTLSLALTMIKEDWDKNPDSVSKVIDLSIEKLHKIQELLKSKE